MYLYCFFILFFKQIFHVILGEKSNILQEKCWHPAAIKFIFFVFLLL